MAGKTYDGRESSTNLSRRAGLLVEEVQKGLLSSPTLVGEGLKADVLLALREELDGRVALDAVPGSEGLVAGVVGVKLGNDDVGLVGKVDGELLKDGLERFAVLRFINFEVRSRLGLGSAFVQEDGEMERTHATPRSSVGNEDVLVLSESNRVVVGDVKDGGERRRRGLDLALEAGVRADEGSERVEVSTGRVVDRVERVGREVLERRESLDAKLLAEVCSGGK